MLGAITVGGVELVRKRFGWSETVNSNKHHVIVSFPKEISDDALWKLGRFAMELADKDEGDRDGTD